MDIKRLLHSSFRPSVLSVQNVDIGVLEGTTFFLEMKIAWLSPVPIRRISCVVPFVRGEAVWSHLCRGQSTPLCADIHRRMAQHRSLGSPPQAHCAEPNDSNPPEAVGFHKHVLSVIVCPLGDKYLGFLQ